MKKYFSCSFICCLFSLIVSAQPEKTDTAIIRKIKTEETAHSQIEMVAHQLTDVCGPRLTNSPGYRRAISWVTKTFNEWGLQHAGPEAWGEFGMGWNTEDMQLTMRQPYFQRISAYPVAWTKSTDGLVTAPLLLVDGLDSTSLSRLGDTVKGKILLRKPGLTSIKSPFDTFATRYTNSQLKNITDDYMFTKAQIDTFVGYAKDGYEDRLYAESKGALGLLVSSAGSRDGTIFVGGGPAYQKKYRPSFPELAIGREDYLKLVRLLTDKLEVKLNLQVQNKFYDDDLTGYNVVGEIPGVDPKLKNQVVMLGGHLDSWHAATGATDNAAGCAVMMEAIRILQALGVKPRRTIRIALWGGEEQGPYGSFGYVKNHYGDPVDMKLKPDQKNISVYYNLDNGSGKIRGIYTQNNEKVQDIFAAWLAPFAAMGAATVTAANTGSTDHLSFDAVGIPAFEFIQDPLEYETRSHHSNMDSYDHLLMDDLKQAAVIVASFVYNSAMRDELLPRKPLPKPSRFVFDTDFPF